jgi:hypothetical protein
MAPTTAAVMQLMDLGMISALKLYYSYLHCMLKKLTEETNVNNELNLHEFWQSFYITDCVQIVGEIAILAKMAGFEDVSEDDVAQLLESHSLPLTNEKLAEMDKLMYKDAQDDNNNDENIVSEENTLTIKCLREAFSKIDEAVDYFWNHDPLYDSSTKVEC